MATLGSREQTMSFFSKVRRDEFTLCWNWVGFVNDWGYGKVTIDNVLYGAHRASYLMFNGNLPENSVVRHKCDNPACVNPSHLEIGSHADNARDKAVRCRTQTKISNKQVLEIRDSKERGVVLALKFGVSTAAVSLIKNMKRRKHIGE